MLKFVLWCNVVLRTTYKDNFITLQTSLMSVADLFDRHTQFPPSSLIFVCDTILQYIIYLVVVCTFAHEQMIRSTLHFCSHSPQKTVFSGEGTGILCLS